MDTPVPCTICKGTKINPSHKRQCGACLGTGESTFPWHRRRRGTTVGLSETEVRAVTDAPLATVAKDEGLLLAAVRLARPSLINLSVTGTATAASDRIIGVLISWDNPDFRTETGPLC
jgi:hypothetical protein